MDFVLSTVCVWQTYTIGTPPPAAAQKVGFVRWGEELFDVHLARYIDSATGEPVAAWVQRNNGMGHRVDNYKMQLISNQRAEILVCPSFEQYRLRWVKFTDDTDLGRCLPMGVNRRRERMYVSRFQSPISLKCLGNDVYGVVPGAFAPSEGYVTTEFCGVNAARDVELFCLEKTAY